MNKVLLDNGATYYGADHPQKGIVIYLHGLTQGHEAPFAQAAIQSMANRDFGVLALEFDFLKKHSAPSEKLQAEIKQLSEAVEFVKSRFKEQEIYLVGKSLGGCIALAYAAISPYPNTKNICILGLPLALGFPPRTELLKGTPAEEFDPVKEYDDLFKKINIPIHVIQGGADDLGPVEKYKRLLNNNNVTLDVVEGADHSFFAKGEGRWKSCFNWLAKYLN